MLSSKTLISFKHTFDEKILQKKCRVEIDRTCLEP